MSIISVKEAGDRRMASMDDKGVRKYMRMFRVVTDSPLMDSLNARDAPGVPSMFDQYSTDTGADSDALVQSKEAREMPDNPFLWEVDVHYSSDCDDPTEGIENPLDRPPLYKWSTEIVRVPAGAWNDGEDLLGFKICNSVGAPFDPPPEIEIAHRVLTITRNEDDFDPIFLDQFAFCLNADDFLGYEAGQGRMDPAEGEETFEGGTRFFKVTYTIRFRTLPYSWYLRPADISWVEPDGNGGLRTILDTGGTALSRPIFFDGAGNRNNPQPGTPFYFDFQVYPFIDFGELDLETYYSTFGLG